MLFFFARAYVKHLEKQVAFWQTAWKYERQRANVAYDRLLREKGVEAITAPVMADTAEETDAEKLLREALANQDFMNAGQG